MQALLPEPFALVILNEVKDLGLLGGVSPRAIRAVTPDSQEGSYRGRARQSAAKCATLIRSDAMKTANLDKLLSQLEAARYRFGRKESAPVLKFLHQLDRARISDPGLLIRFHEALLFLRAFPQGPSILQATERILNRFRKKVEALRELGVSLDDWDTFEHSGVSGTTMEDTLSFDVARWLVPGQTGKRGRTGVSAPHVRVEIAWDSYDPGRELGTTGPRFVPLLEDDAFVEADTPFQRWLKTAAGRKKATAGWLIERFDRLPLPDTQKSELYDSLRIPLRWSFNNSPISRTRNWHRPKHPYYHQGPLIPRNHVSLAEQLSRPAPKLTKLSLREGQRIADQIREIMLVRYRELYGTTLADPRSVIRVDNLGRGLEIYLWNLPPDRRLPLRAYTAGFTLKNGVPINYIEAIGLCEWMEVGFNTFYTFRGGEAGWIYAQVLRSLCALMGTTVISVYPYQLGHDNEEAIESGAFWFYRKLGFRPGRPDLRRLVEQEEKKIAACGAGAPVPQYRTPARTLKRLATGHVFYDVERGAAQGSEPSPWDSFSTRNIGLRVNECMSRKFKGDPDRMRHVATHTLECTLGVSTVSWTPLEKSAFENLALALTQVSALRAWTRQEKEGLVRVIRAKCKPNEMLYLRLTQQHRRLRETLLKAGLGQRE